MLPEILTAIQGVAVDNESSPAQKLKAAEMLLALHTRVLTAENEHERTEVARAKARAQAEAARAERARIAMESKKADLAIAAKRRRMQRVLDKAAKQMEKS